ncbi:alkaline phosphatase family protein [soil metagenome]
MRTLRFTCPCIWVLAAALLSAHSHVSRGDVQSATVPVGQEQFKFGRQADGRIIVPTNQVLDPVGKQVLFPGRPVDLALLDEGRTVLVKNMKDLLLIDVATGAIKQTLVSPVGFSATGLLVYGQKVYVTDSKDHVRVALRQPNGELAWVNPLTLPKPAVGGSAYPTGIARRSNDVIWVNSSRGNSVHLLQAVGGKMIQEIPVGVAPYSICCPRPDLCYVTNWGGDRPKTDDRQAPSSGTPTKVDKRGVANQGTVSVLQPVQGRWQQTRTIIVGLHPSGMAMSQNGDYVYVANANSDTVSVIRTDSGQVAETISCRPEGRLPFGSGCNALVLSPDGQTLYVANGTNNCLAVVKLGNKAGATGQVLPASRLAGLIPTGWYPGAVTMSADGKKLIVANVKGLGSLAHRRPADKAERPAEQGMNSHDHLGSISIIDIPDDAELVKLTQRVNANNRLAYSLSGLEKPRPDATPVPVPLRHGEPSLFKHVIYIVKENRTYDQIFGDMEIGNGDKNLCMFGEEVTPNHHKLAREFTLFDNFYCSGVLSADGHQWVNEAYVTDYLEKAFGGFTRSYPYDGDDPIAYAWSGFLWDNALARKKTFRNFGEFVKPAAPRGSTWLDMYRQYQNGDNKFPVEARVTVKSLVPYTQPGYAGFVMTIPDVYRAKIFIDWLATCERSGEFPNLIYLYLPCDHTSGTRPGQPTPRAMVADNDLALGRVVEAVSKSRFWNDTVLFAVEDDPQNGFDHVDSHRTVGMAISAYNRRKTVDSTCYNQTGMVKTIELILGLSPMNQLDLSATAMRNCFQSKPDLTPFTAAANRIPLDELNPPLKQLKGKALARAKQSLELNLDEVDAADEDTFNRILWHAVMGDAAPYPAQFVGGRGEDH